MRTKHIARLTSVVCGVYLCFTPFFAGAQTADPVDREGELQGLIDGKTQAIKDLEAEIGQYQEQLKQIGGQKQSLQNEIKSLDITRKKLNADIQVTENKITKTNYQLEALSIDIKDKEGRIGSSRSAIGDSLRILNNYDQQSLVESLLGTEDLSAVWNDIENIETVQGNIRARISELSVVKDSLEDKQTASMKIKGELTSLRSQLSNQKKIADYNAKEKKTLLSKTKNSEAAYQKALKEKQALRDAFEQELLGFESELKLLIDPSSIPDIQHGILAWPLDSILITQWFGNTQFAKENPQVYNGKGHNGIDLRASVGTPIKSARRGEVVDSGNTDTVCPNASYGKWVLVKHDNGLSTLYAHLSLISVSKGQAVSEGSLLGYSGNTGYSTGPHLHFTVYATQGVEVLDRKSRVCGGTYRMPVADLRAYLNPIPYLPVLP